MRLKSELYKKEQEEIVDKIITILDLENSGNMNSRLSPTLSVTKVLFDICHL